MLFTSSWLAEACKTCSSSVKFISLPDIVTNAVTICCYLMLSLDSVTLICYLILSLSFTGFCYLQANGQAAFFVALFRKDTRDLIMQWVQWALPTSIPLLSLHQTPAHFLQSFVDNRIQSFQDGVDRRAAAQQADPRCADSARHMLCQPVT